MKNYLFKTLAATAMCFAAQALEAQTIFENDTTTIIAPDTVRLVNSHDSYHVEVKGAEGHPEFHYSYTVMQDSSAVAITRNGWNFNVPFMSEEHKSRKRATWEMGVGGISFGFIHALDAPDRMNVSMGRSFEISMPRLLYFSYDNFILAGGINWKNYRMMGRNYFSKENANITLNTYPEDIDPKFSRIKIFSWTLSCFYRVSFSRNYGMMFGPMINFNTHGSMLSKYTTAEGEKKTYKDKNIHQVPVSVDFLIDFRVFQNLHVYLKYAPCNVLQEDFGPKFSGLSTGLGICL